MASKKSVTGQYLTGVRSVPVPAKRRKRQPNKTLRVVGAKANNLRDITVEFPLGISTCVTGVSGGGKTTLTIETLRSDKRRAGKEGVSTCRSRWWTET